MRLWRLTRATHAAAPLSGQGAAIAGGRWNSPGVRLAYTSTSRPLAVLEMLVHVTRDTVPPEMILIPIDVPDRWVAQPERLPAEWSNLPISAGARNLGDTWVQEARSVALLVPSIVLPAERNVLINPAHPQIRRVRVLPPERFAFDRRLLR
jgi:RES domain-containing protein